MPHFNDMTYGNQGKSQRYYVGLDIGSTKICCLVATFDSKTETLNVLGVGYVDSDGIKNGVIVNVDRVAAKIKDAVSQAQQQSGLAINNVTVGLSGDHLESIVSQGVVGVSNANHEVKADDISRLINETRTMFNFPEKKILDLVPQDFMIDNQVRTNDPIGMSGLRVQGNVLVLTSLLNPFTNLERCLERAGITANKIVPQPIAGSKPIVTNEEKEMGVAIIDIGGGTTEISVYYENVYKFASVIGISGKNITDDIASIFNIQNKLAENIKKEHGIALESAIIKDDFISVPGISGRAPKEFSRKYLAKIIQARLEEIFEFCIAEIKASGVYDHLKAGIVLTGGVANMPAIDELAYNIFNLPVKIGVPDNLRIEGLIQEVNNPIYTSVVGLTLMDIDSDKGQNQKIELPKIEKVLEIVEDINGVDIKDESSTPKNTSKFKSIFSRAIETIKEM